MVDTAIKRHDNAGVEGVQRVDGVKLKYRQRKAEAEGSTAGSEIVTFVGGSWNRSWMGPTKPCRPVDSERRDWLGNSRTAMVGCRFWSILGTESTNRPQNRELKKAETSFGLESVVRPGICRPTWNLLFDRCECGTTTSDFVWEDATLGKRDF
jgi:hypothetical protein